MEAGGVTAALRERGPPTPVEPGGAEPIPVALDPTALELCRGWGPGTKQGFIMLGIYYNYG